MLAYNPLILKLLSVETISTAGILRVSFIGNHRTNDWVQRRTTRGEMAVSIKMKS